MLVTIVCAWCRKEMAQADWPGVVPFPAVTHSVCPDCLEKQLAEVGKQP